ncbi:hypothetical protein ACFQI3_06915 [Hansschlegelia quercus]|uniref:Motility protein n=1 Tax=Hansschlegelia quercus TaxID=2528245 RepID=A0A4Q9GK68_9HYPH|nr:hypothetical protein [Hansschlegelia quercus]TBN53721.1 hypothetical protein EYR15_07925 [Hansschlegelia quercus]
MDVSSLAASAVATSAQSTRDGFSVAALKIANDQQQLMANFVQQSAETTKALTQSGVGETVDKTA